MAWAVVDDASGEGVAVAMHAGMLSVGNGQRLVEISDDAAASVLTGRSPARYVLGRPAVQTMPAPVQQIPTPQRRQMAYTTRYPAMLTDADVDALAEIARGIRYGATAVEIGSRFGGSAKVILENAPNIKRMYCIDSDWQNGSSLGMDDPGVAAIAQRWNTQGHRTAVDFARSYLSAHAGVRLIGRSSPYDLSWWSEKTDFVFEDSSHVNPQMTDNLWFWWNHLAPGGLMAGHDYGSGRYPDVSSAVDAFAAEVKLPLNIRSNIWWIGKP